MPLSLKVATLCENRSGLSSPQGRKTLFSHKVATVGEDGVSAKQTESHNEAINDNRDGCLKYVILGAIGGFLAPVELFRKALSGIVQWLHLL